MNLWKQTMVFTAASLMLAGTAFAQSGSSSPPTQSEPAKPGQPDPTKQQKGVKEPGSMQKTPSGMEKSGDRVQKSGDPTQKSGDQMQKKGTMSGAADDGVKAVQEALKGKGHDPGPVDGIMGPRTSTALKEFQKSQGLRETGQLDAETRSKLEM